MIENEWLDEGAVEIVKRIIGVYMNDSEMCNLGFIALRRMLSGVDGNNIFDSGTVLFTLLYFFSKWNPKPRVGKKGLLKL